MEYEAPHDLYVRPHLDEDGLRQLATEMLEKGQAALRVRKSKLGVGNLGFLADFRHVRYLGIEEVSRGRLPPDNLAAFLTHGTLKSIYPCLDFDGDAVVNQQAEQVLSPRFGTGLLDAETPEFSFRQVP